MDWLNWVVRIASVLGGIFFLAFALVGFFAVLGVWRETMILWGAKKKWLALQRQEAGFRAHYESKTEND
jgi:hypothetical protein